MTAAQTQRPDKAPGTFATYFHPELVFLDVPWKSSEELFNNIGSVTETQGYAHPGYGAALATREQNYPTGLVLPDVSVAIPHANPENIQTPFIAFIRPAAPIEFGAMGGDGTEKLQAKFVFVLGVLNDGLQVKLLQTILGALGHAEVIEQLAKVSDPDEAVAVLNTAFSE